MKFSVKEFFRNPQFPADLVIFTEEILNEKLDILCSENCSGSPLLLMKSRSYRLFSSYLLICQIPFEMLYILSLLVVTNTIPLKLFDRDDWIFINNYNNACESYQHKSIFNYYQFTNDIFSEKGETENTI